MSLTELNLVAVLEQAANGQHAGSDVQRSAELQLKEWEVQEGYHYLLQSIYLDLTVSLQVRWLAIIQFKNGLDKYWRSTRINAIKKEEKQQIRNRIFNLIEEPNDRLAIQNAQAAARIARIDFPVEWPQLFDQLEVILNDDNVWTNDVKIYNVLIHINQIIKILAVARIGRCRPAMQAKVPMVFHLLVRVYLNNFNQWTGSPASLEVNSLSKLQISYLALKVLRRIVVDGYEAPQKDKTVLEFMSLVEQHFQLLLRNYETFKTLDIYEKFIKCYGKLFFNLINASPANFVMFPSSQNILVIFTEILIERAPDVYHENTELQVGFWESVAIRGFLILKKLISFISKKGAISIKVRSDKAEVNAAISRISTGFLSEDLIRKLLDLLMDWYLKLRPIDLENWSMDPEEWINEQMASSYEFQIRSCAENFFQELINTFQPFLADYLLRKIEHDASLLTSSLEDFLKKDAIFCSFQLSSHAIADMVDFDKLLEAVFLPEASRSDVPPDQLRVIRRRVALVIDDWVGVKSSEHSRKQCYQFFLHILKTEPDKVVRLSIVKALRTMVDDWDFKKTTFEPYLNDYVTIFLQELLPNASLLETRMYILNTLTDIIIQTKPLVNKQLLMEILDVLPKLWDVASNDPTESILGNVLLRLLKSLASALGPYSYATWDISLSIIEVACNPASSHSSLLMEDGLELWSSLLQNYNQSERQFDQRFISLAGYLQAGVENHTELLPTSLEILKSYALILSPGEFLSCPPFVEIIRELSYHLLKLRDDSFTILFEIWDILALSDESEEELSIIYSFSVNNVFNSILNAIFLEEQLSTYQAGQLFSLLARISFSSPKIVIDLLLNYQKQLPDSITNAKLSSAERKLISNETSFDDVVKIFFDFWCKCYGAVYDPRLKKIHLLGISSLLRTGSPIILLQFKLISALWVESLEEINETLQGDCEKYHLSDTELNEESTSEQYRQLALVKNKDPAHNVSLKAFITETLSLLQSQMGQFNFQELTKTLDPPIMENLQLFLSIKPQ